jgi:hypothetical protein
MTRAKGEAPDPQHSAARHGARLSALEDRVQALETAAAKIEEAKKRGWWSWLREGDPTQSGQ